ncbi:hypothetical protein LINGRAHAP2_LOCUS14997 [Linum grandiflorum]
MAIRTIVVASTLCVREPRLSDMGSAKSY